MGFTSKWADSLLRLINPLSLEYIIRPIVQFSTSLALIRQMADDEELQDRIKSLESQLQDVQKRTRDLMSPPSFEPASEARDSPDFRETSSFPPVKDSDFPVVKERSNRATGRYDQDVGDLAQSKEMGSSEGEEETRRPEAPQQPQYPQQGMYYPMYPPPYYPMSYVPPPAYQSFEGRPYWPPQPPTDPARADEDHKAEISRLKEQYEEIIRDKEEQIERLQQDAEEQGDEGDRVRALVQRVRALEAELAHSKGEMSTAKEYIEKFKLEMDERERGLKYQLQETEGNNQILREKVGKLEANLTAERGKSAAALDKAAQSEEVLENLQGKLTATLRDLDEIKRNRLQYIQKYQSDADALKKEVKSLNNALEQSYLQLDQAKYELQQSERRAKAGSQEQANFEINRLTQQVHLLQRQLEAVDTGRLTSSAKAQRPPQTEESSSGRAAGRSRDLEVTPQARKPPADSLYEESRPGRAAPPQPDIEQQYEWAPKVRPPSSDLSFETQYSRPVKPAPESETRYEWAEKPVSRARPARDEPEDPIQSLESQLLSLQMEKQQLESEYLKLPDRARTLVGRKRKEEIEGRLKAIDASLGGVKGQLRSLKVLHK